jgi:hypothetical protein
MYEEIKRFEYKILCKRFNKKIKEITLDDIFNSHYTRLQVLKKDMTFEECVDQFKKWNYRVI